jgi:anti-sigma factor RsiW
MRCHEFHEIMRAYVDGEVERSVGTDATDHLAGCTACAGEVEDIRRWDAALTACLDHELPSDLRIAILGEPAGDSTPRTDPNGLGLLHKLQSAWSNMRRDLARPRGIVTAAVVATVLILAVAYRPSSRRTDPTDDSFRRGGPVVQMGDKVVWQPGDTFPTARLSLSGRLI